MRPTCECTLVERMQEVQKAILKTGQALVSLAEDVLQAKNCQGTFNPEDLLRTLSDALSFVGHAGYQVSLKRRYLLKPELSKVCSRYVLSRHR